MDTDDRKQGRKGGWIRWPFTGWLCFLASGLLAVQVRGGGELEGGDLRTLDGLVGQWMALRTTLAEEKREWGERRRQWEEEISLLEKEADTLRREREDGGTQVTTFEAKRAEALARKERMEGELRQLRAVLDRAEADLRRWSGRIPEGLAAPLAAGFGALPLTQKQADGLPLIRRAQTVAALYTQIETLQNRFHAVRETLEAEGVRRQADVLYLGLARAFAVSPGNDWAAVGVPTDTGWAWRPAPGEAAVVRQAIEVLNRQATAELVDLPLQVAGGESP